RLVSPTTPSTPEMYSLSLHDALPISQVNYLLMAGVLFITFSFGSSSALGSAYGVSVIGAMLTSSLLAIIAIWKVSKRSLWVAVRSEEHTSELQSHLNLVCRLLLEKKI